jgi:hypothetical protein
LAPKGLLIEEQRTNLCLYSSAVGGTGWALTSGGVGTLPTVTLNAAVAPDGTSTASRIQLSLGGGTTTTDQALVIQALTGTSCRGSFYVKTNDNSTKTIYVRGQNATSFVVDGAWRRYDFDAGTLSTTQFGIGLRGGQGLVNSNTADILVWGAQLEAGAFATSYIPTVASQVTRSADSASMTGTNFSSWYNANAGTLYGEAVSNNTSDAAVSASNGGQCIVSIYSTAGRRFNGWLIGRDDAGGDFGKPQSVLWRADGAALTTLEVGSNQLLAGSSAKLASAFDGTGFSFSANGLAAATGATQSRTEPNTLVIGQSPDSVYSSLRINGTIKSIAYYPRRLSNTELQIITS